MKVLVPLENRFNVYHNNLFKAPRFALYTIDRTKYNIYCSLQDIIENPNTVVDEHTSDNYGICDQKICTKEHLEEHHLLSKHIKECDYVLGVHFCDNTLKAFQFKGTNIYKISPFLRSTETAIKNFLLGVSLASTLQHIHFRT